MTKLTLSGGVIESRGGGQLHLLGDLSVPLGTTRGSIIRRSTGPGVLNLGQDDRTFYVGRGTGNIELTIEIPDRRAWRRGPRQDR